MGKTSKSQNRKAALSSMETLIQCLSFVKNCYVRALKLYKERYGVKSGRYGMA